eukprot:SAG22_NODE_649_length_8157_cov_30.400099_5_plen_154_part_00
MCSSGCRLLFSDGADDAALTKKGAGDITEVCRSWRAAAGRGVTTPSQGRKPTRAMATAGGGAASEREQTALGYLVEQSGLDEKEVQAAAGANELGRILNGLPEAVKTVYYKMKVAEMKVAKEAAAMGRPQLVEEVKACMKDNVIFSQADQSRL